MAAKAIKREMSQQEFEEMAYPLTLSGMADYAQEWMDQYRPSQEWPANLDDACAAAWKEEMGRQGQVTPKLRRVLVDWFSDHY